MPYSKFTFREVKKQFGLTERRTVLFKEVAPKSVSKWLKETLERMKIIPSRNEKARSESIVAPLLAEVSNQNAASVSLLSGERLDVAIEEGLSGECDFIISATPYSSTVDTPLFIIVEAKQNIIENSLGQCTAQLIGAQRFNLTEGNPIKTIYGCVTNGNEWQFLQLSDKQLLVNEDVYYISEPERIVGISQHIIDEIVPAVIA